MDQLEIHPNINIRLLNIALIAMKALSNLTNSLISPSAGTPPSASPIKKGVMYPDMETPYLSYKIPGRIARISLIIGFIPLVPFLIGFFIANIFDIRVTEATAPDVPFGELLYALNISFWGLLASVPIAVLGFTISAIWFLCVWVINISRRYNDN